MKKTYLMNGLEANKGAINFSGLLDAPAGKHGFLKTRDGLLYFEDGIQFKAFGASVVSAGCCPEHEIAIAVAERIASAGMNFVRIINADTKIKNNTQKTGGLLIDYSKNNSRSYNLDAFEKLDFLINELNKRGVYVQMDTYVGRDFYPEGDELDYPDSFPTTWPTKHANIYNRRLIELQKEYDRELLNHVNQYKGVRYADDPGIAVVQVMNENSLLWDFSAYFRISTNPPSYMQELRSKWTNWLKNKYKTQETFVKAWTNADGVCAVLPDDNVNVFVEVPTDLYHTSFPIGVPYDAKYDMLNSPPRHSDYAEFLTEIENIFCMEIYDFLRNEIGVKCCINTTCLSYGAASVYTTTLNCDLQEQTEYYNHPAFGFQPPVICHTTPMYKRDPREDIRGISSANMLTRINAANVENKPMILAEWNDTFPTLFYSEAMYMMTAYGSLNDWAGLCSFQYNGQPDHDGLQFDHLHNYFTIYNNPGMFGETGVCSAAFQSGYVKRAKNTIDIVYTECDRKSNNPYTYPVPNRILPFISRTRAAFHSGKYNGNADVAVTGGFTPTADLTQAKHAVVFSENPFMDAFQQTEGRKAFLDKHRDSENKDFRGIGTIGKTRAVIENASKLFANDNSYGEVIDYAMKVWGLWDKEQGIVDNVLISDTGEIKFDLNKHVFTINTDKFKVFAGDVNQTFKLGLMNFTLNNKNMSVSLLSKDGKPLDSSKHILITAVGECCNTDMKRDGDWLLDMGHAPIWIDQIDGNMTIPDIKNNIKIYSLKPNGERGELLASKHEKDCVIFDFTTSEGAIHFEMVKE